MSTKNGSRASRTLTHPSPNMAAAAPPTPQVSEKVGSDETEECYTGGYVER